MSDGCGSGEINGQATAALWMAGRRNSIIIIIIIIERTVALFYCEARITNFTRQGPADFGETNQVTDRHQSGDDGKSEGEMSDADIIAGKPWLFKEVELQRRLTRRAIKISDRTNLFGRVLIRLRMLWFMRRQVSKRRASCPRLPWEVIHFRLRISH